MTSPANRVRDAWDGMKDKVDDMKEDMGDAARRELGLWMHRSVTQLFWFDKQVREYDREIRDAARDGRREEALQLSYELENYITYEMEHNRKYKARMKDIADRMEDNKEVFQKKVEKMKKAGRLVDWLSNRNRMDGDKLKERIEADMK